VISHAVWLYYRFSLSFRDVEDLLAPRGVTVTYETIRRWCAKFGRDYARKLKRREGRLGDTWHLDEVFVTINGQRQYLWRAVDQEGAVLDILVQPRRDARAAIGFFRRLLRGQGSEPARLVTDKLRSYGVAWALVMPAVVHDMRQYTNNRAEVSHQPTRERERQMRRFKSQRQAPRRHGRAMRPAVAGAWRLGCTPWESRAGRVRVGQCRSPAQQALAALRPIRKDPVVTRWSR
jgi:putative transposase